MSTTKRVTPRTVPAARIVPLHNAGELRGDLVMEAIEHLYKARGLGAGALLLSARARLAPPSDKRLRAQSRQLAKHALEACAACSSALDERAAPADGHGPKLLASAQGQFKAAVACLEAMESRDTHDETVQALDLYAATLERLEEAERAMVLAHDAMMSEAA